MRTPSRIPGFVLVSVELIAQRRRFQTIAAVDVAPDIVGAPLAALVDTPGTGLDGVTVTNDLSTVDDPAGAVAIVVI